MVLLVVIIWSWNWKYGVCVRRKEEVHSVCAEQIMWSGELSIHVYVHKTIIVSRMVEIEATIRAYSTPMLPV